jgi:hypothetical protein
MEASVQLVDLKCPACGGIISQRITSRMITCEYCNSRFALDDDEADAFIEDDEEYYEEEDEAASSLSMADFAAQACEDFLDEVGNSSSFNSSPKILRGLEVGDEEVFLIHDDTLFKSGKNGFAITGKRNLRFRNIFADNRKFHDFSDTA